MSFLLGGRVRHDQPAEGHRSGIEPVLLAASIPASPGEQVLEGGTGSGAALLCLAARVPGVGGIGIEREPLRAAQAAANVAANGFCGLEIRAGDLTEQRPGSAFHHAMANPPWHAADGSASPDPQRETARRGRPALLSDWAASLARTLRPRGTLTFIVAAAVMPEALAAFSAAGCGSLAVLPLWPRVSVAAKLVLVRGVRAGRGPFRLLPGLALHEADGTYTKAAEAILRDGAALPL